MMGILVRQKNMESTIFSLIGEGWSIKRRHGKVTQKVPDSVFTSLSLPLYNEIVFEDALKQTDLDLWEDIHK